MAKRKPVIKTVRLHQFMMRRSDRRFICWNCGIEMNDLANPTCLHPDAPIWTNKKDPEDEKPEVHRAAEEPEEEYVEQGYTEDPFYEEP